MAQDPEDSAGDAQNGGKQDKKKLKAKQRKATQKLNKQLRRWGVMLGPLLLRV